MNRRQLLRQSAAFGFMAAIPLSVSGIPQGDADPADSLSRATKPRALLNRLKPPEHGPIPVACLISDDAVLIDFGGPWEVFGNVMVGGSMDSFRLYTVAETTKPIRASGGMQIVPDYSIATAPAPRVIVIPAQGKPSEAVLEWIRKSSKTADITMSVCTGAYVLAQTGLLAGKTATTHHAAYVDFARKFPDIHAKRGVRYVDDGNLASAGGLACGIDLAHELVGFADVRLECGLDAFDGHPHMQLASERDDCFHHRLGVTARPREATPSPCQKKCAAPPSKPRSPSRRRTRRSRCWRA